QRRRPPRRLHLRRRLPLRRRKRLLRRSSFAGIWLCLAAGFATEYNWQQREKAVGNDRLFYWNPAFFVIKTRIGQSVEPATALT
ncbi:MAG: hypothetical protein ACI93T_001062, partial [Porticoccaceae bacterium]